MTEAAICHLANNKTTKATKGSPCTLCIANIRVNDTTCQITKSPDYQSENVSSDKLKMGRGESSHVMRGSRNIIADGHRHACRSATLNIYLNAAADRAATPNTAKGSPDLRDGLARFGMVEIWAYGSK